MNTNFHEYEDAEETIDASAIKRRFVTIRAYSWLKTFMIYAERMALAIFAAPITGGSIGGAISARGAKD
jgi:hypothetical protein